VKGGWLEHEIRSLPQVLACSITPDDVVVLIGPSVDPQTVERRVDDVLRKAGVNLPVRVFGGERPVFVEPVRVRNGRYALVGSLGGAAILAAGVWLAGATTALRGPKGKNPVVTLAPPPPKKLVLIPMVGGDAPTPDTPLPAQESKPLLKPVKRSGFAVQEPSRPAPGEKPAVRPASPPVEEPPSEPSEPSEPEVKILLRDIKALVDRLGGGVRR
jgi:hypothetical protein